MDHYRGTGRDAFSRSRNYLDVTTFQKAPAKLNLGLRILSRRPDGYHDIRSVFHEISLSDHLEISVREGSGRITVLCDAGVPSGPDNLAWKAAELFIGRSGELIDVSILIRKKIPAKAGLGGGSSDAACVLRTLACITGRQDVNVSSIAESIGSDVPFFMSGGAALVEGRGEKVTIIPCISFHAVLIHPPTEVSTPEAYALWDRSRNPPSGGQSADLTNGNMIRHYSASSAVWHEGKPFPLDLRNDFLPLLEEQIPEIAEIARFLKTGSCKYWGLSGSGPTFFVLFQSFSEALGFSQKLHWKNSICRSADTAGASSNG
jgi:4-diphosphocytidyl-2-C-methyl-D-erythritol kinase